MRKARGFSLMSGGLDSQLAIKVLERAGAEVEALCFSSPFFSSDLAHKTADALGVKLNIIDFTDDIISLVENPKRGFGGAMNPCIDCHATMIKRAGELMVERGFDFVATGEVMGQRPMSQNKQSLGIVERDSGLKGRLVRPLSAKLLEPTIPESEGILNRDALLDIQGRSRDRQIALAEEFGIKEYPSPAGGCKLTEDGFCRKLKDLKDNETLANRRLVELLVVGRRFRLPDGSSVILGRDRVDNARLKNEKDLGVVLAPINCPGPTALIPEVKSENDLMLALELVCTYSKYDRLPSDIIIKNITDDITYTVPRPYQREKFKDFQIC
ncbi:MAG: tRNA 4-thiouridine(8) synthase ThiI [Kiritimatiellae bacterium]|nr:tRNA 4-thiouridine(8) synthase ThiI [Kiritimatiellia bacterium]